MHTAVKSRLALRKSRNLRVSLNNLQDFTDIYDFHSKKSSILMKSLCIPCVQGMGIIMLGCVKIKYSSSLRAKVTDSTSLLSRKFIYDQEWSIHRITANKCESPNQGISSQTIYIHMERPIGVYSIGTSEFQTFK